MKARDTSDWPVMSKQCSTCVFKTDARGRWVNKELAEMVEKRMFNFSQIVITRRSRVKSRITSAEAHATARSK